MPSSDDIFPDGSSAIQAPPHVYDFLVETMRALHQHLFRRDEPKWSDTWLVRTRNGQEARTIKNFLKKYNAFALKGIPVDDLGEMGDAMINRVRKEHPELSPAWQDPNSISVMPEDLKEVLLPSEALFAFAGWLTSLEKPLIVGAKYQAGDIAELVGAFCKANHLADPTEYTYVTPVDPRAHA